MRTQNTAQSLGAYSNVLGLVTDDFSQLCPQALVDATGIGASRLAGELHVSRPSIYKKSIKVNPEILDAVMKLVAATDMAYELLRKDVNELKKWVMSPNTLFMGASPFQVCLRGDGEDLIDWLNARLGRTDGAAF